MAKRSIGLDIGTNAVRAAEIRHGDTPTVTRLGQVALASGAVAEGEVVEPAHVAEAVRNLWKDAQIEGKSVRVGIAPSRAIVRSIEVPDLPEGELKSMIGFELSEHVPLDPSETVFDIIPLERIDTENGPRRRVLLAAAPLSAVNPLIETIKLAGLKVEAVDVGPLALSRAFRPAQMSRPDGTKQPSVDAVISIGGETLLAIISEAGQLLFNRKAPSIAGAQLTSRIQDQLSVSPGLAEMAKRRLVTEESRHLLSSVNTMTVSVLDEIADEIQESVDYYLSQLNSRPVDRILLTGGGALLPGLDRAIAERCGYPTFFGDPFDEFAFAVPGLEVEDCAIVATFVASAMGYALGGADRAWTVDLQPKTERKGFSSQKIAAIAIGVASLGGLGYVYSGARSDLDAVTAQKTEMEGRVQTVSQQAATLRTKQPIGLLGKSDMETIVATAYTMRIDWTTAFSALDAIGTPLLVKIDGFTGKTSLGHGDAAAAAGTTANGIQLVAKVSFEATAPDIKSLTSWIDAVEADDRFAQVVSSSQTRVPATEATPEMYRFSVELSLTEAALLPVPADAPKAHPIATPNADSAQTTPGSQP